MKRSFGEVMLVRDGINGRCEKDDLKMSIMHSGADGPARPRPRQSVPSLDAQMQERQRAAALEKDWPRAKIAHSWRKSTSDGLNSAG